MCRANENVASYDKQAATRSGMRLQNVQRIVSEEKPSTRELSYLLNVLTIISKLRRWMTSTKIICDA